MAAVGSAAEVSVEVSGPGQAAAVHRARDAAAVGAREAPLAVESQAGKRSGQRVPGAVWVAGVVRASASAAESSAVYPYGGGRGSSSRAHQAECPFCAAAGSGAPAAVVAYPDAERSPAVDAPDAAQEGRAALAGV